MNTTLTHQITTALRRGRVTSATRRARAVVARRLASGAGGEAGMSTVEYSTVKVYNPPRRIGAHPNREAVVNIARGPGRNHGRNQYKVHVYMKVLFT